MESIELLVVLLMIFINGVFAAYEIALASVSLSRLQSLVESQRAGADSALQMKEGIEKSLAVVQLGITLVGLIAGATGGASAVDDIAPFLLQLGFHKTLANFLALIVVVVPLTALTIVLGELVPKLFALRNKEWICLKLSPMMKWFALSTWPVIWVLEESATGLMNLSEKFWRPQPHADARTEAAELQELRAITQLARSSRLIGTLEESIILGAARLAARPVKEILLPAEHIRFLNYESSLNDCLITAHMDMHTRFPVAERAGDPQSIIGYVTFKDIVAILKLSPHEPSLGGILRDIPSFPDTMPIATILEKLLHKHTHIALLHDNQQQTVGMITLEDIFEELLGDIKDEQEDLPIHIIRSGHGWIIGGGARLERIEEVTGIALQSPPGQQYLSGWMLEQLGQAPTGGEMVHTDQFRVLVRKVRRQAVLEAALNPVAVAVASASSPQQTATAVVAATASQQKKSSD